MDSGQNLTGGKVYFAPLGTDMPTAEELERGVTLEWTDVTYSFEAPRPEEAYRPNRAARRAAARKARRA